MKDPIRRNWLYFGSLGFGALAIASVATGGGQLEFAILAGAALICFLLARHYSKD